MPLIIFSLNVPIVPTRRNVAMARLSLSASQGSNFAATMAIRIACSWNSGTPSVFFRTSFSSSGSCGGAGLGYLIDSGSIPRRFR